MRRLSDADQKLIDDGNALETPYQRFSYIKGALEDSINVTFDGRQKEHLRKLFKRVVG